MCKVRCIVGFFKSLGYLAQLILQILIRIWMPKEKKSSKPKAVAKRKTARSAPYKKQVSLRKNRAGKAGVALDHNNDKYRPEVGVSVMFNNIGENMILHLDTMVPGDFVMAAVAWLTSKPILEALIRARERGVIVLVILHKEKWLRTGGQSADWQKKLRKLYDTLGTQKLDVLESLFKAFNPTNTEWTFSSKVKAPGVVRCAGDWIANTDRGARRMHHKFVVTGCRDENLGYIARAVWTGSYNFSSSAEASLENAVLIYDWAIGYSYANEFAMIYLNSEPLDWVSNTMLPEFAMTP